MKNYEQIMQDRDVKAALDFLLPRVKTVQMYSIVKMLKEEIGGKNA